MLPSAAWCRRAVLFFSLPFCGSRVFCGVVLPCSVLQVVLWCPHQKHRHHRGCGAASKTAMPKWSCCMPVCLGWVVYPARHPRTLTEQSTATINSTHQHTTAKHTQDRAHSIEKHHQTQRTKAQDTRATDSIRGHDTASSGTKQSQAKQHSARQHSGALNNTSNAAQHSAKGHGTAHRSADIQSRQATM